MRTSPPLVAAAAAFLLLPAVPAAAQEQAEGAEILGAPAAFSDAFAEERIAVAAGSTLRELPDPRAPMLAIVDAPSELPLLGRRGGWARVRYGALKGWVLLDAGEGAAAEAVAGGPSDRSAGRPAPLPARAADPELLRRAVAHLDPPGGGPAGRLGPFPFYTDLADPALTAYLGRLVEEVLRVYPERFGLDPGPGAAEPQEPAAATPMETIVLFRREAEYRGFTESEVAPAGLREGGFAGFGLAGLYVGSRSREEVAALLVHEVTHLLNARALGPRTPPWLEEGLANDLSYARIDGSGRLHPGELGGARHEGRREVRDERGRGGWEVTVTTAGGVAALDHLAEALTQGRLPSLATLTSLGWREMVDPGTRQTAYAASGFFVRYLLDDEALAVGFRAHLRSLPAGDAGEGPDLLRHLGFEDGDWQPLEQAFHRWLRAQAVAAGV